MKKEVSIFEVNPMELKVNEVNGGLYAIPENYEMMKESIQHFGILEPLIICGDVVVSGTIRLKIAQELQLEKVPVIFSEETDVEMDLLVVGHNQQRIKKPSEIIKEYKILEKAYPVGKGSRTDKDPEKKKNKTILESYSTPKSKIQVLKSLMGLAIEVYGSGSEETNQLWKKIDEGKVKPTRALKNLKKEQAKKVNASVIPSSINIIGENVKIYNKSCEWMNELADSSVSCIITSPPYYGMRDYGTGDDQRGHEKNVEAFIEGLISDFRDCKRVLKDDGSLWVNLGEAVIDGEYHAIPHRFVLAMKREGWIYNDEIIWIKNNPLFTNSNRTVRSHEYIFHFVKSKDFYFDHTWVSKLGDPNNLVSLGTSGKVSKITSGLDFRGNILRTNSNNMNDLRKACKEEGFYLTHDAAFPVSVPLIAILSSTKVGDSVIDIYSGTSSSGEAALALGRNFIGFEVKSEFVMASKVRLKDYLDESTIVELSDAA